MDPELKLRYQDLLELPDDGRRHELIDGEHYVTPSPNRAHQRAVGNLHVLLRASLEAPPCGEVYLAPFDVLFSDEDVVEPDLLYVSNERAHVVTDDNVKGSPDLVVEVLSPSTRRRDEKLKRRLYERYDVSEYWIVDTDLERIKVFRRSPDGALALAAELDRDRGDVLSTPLLPGLRAGLERVFG
jgi:Uma2 family endonuclease